MRIYRPNTRIQTDHPLQRAVYGSFTTYHTVGRVTRLILPPTSQRPPKKAYNDISPTYEQQSARVFHDTVVVYDRKSNYGHAQHAGKGRRSRVSSQCTLLDNRHNNSIPGSLVTTGYSGTMQQKKHTEEGTTTKNLHFRTGRRLPNLCLVKYWALILTVSTRYTHTLFNR